MVGYLIWAVRVAFKFRPFRLRVDAGRRDAWSSAGRPKRGSPTARITAGSSWSKAQELDSGEIVIQAVTGKSLCGLAWSWFATLFKLRHREQTTTEWRGQKLRLEARPRQKISIDGEIAARTPVTVEVARGAIEVAAPRE